MQSAHLLCAIGKNKTYAFSLSWYARYSIYASVFYLDLALPHGYVYWRGCLSSSVVYDWSLLSYVQERHLDIARYIMNCTFSQHPVHFFSFTWSPGPLLQLKESKQWPYLTLTISIHATDSLIICPRTSEKYQKESNVQVSAMQKMCLTHTGCRTCKPFMQL